MTDLAAVEQLATALLRSTAPAARRKILTAIARDIRRSQSDRIAAQKQPDGSAFTPRRPKPATSRTKGKLRQKRMFTKLRLAKHLRAAATADEATIGFSGTAMRVARIHQFGLSDAPARGMRKVRYVRRELLGLSTNDEGRITGILLNKLLPPPP